VASTPDALARLRRQLIKPITAEGPILCGREGLLCSGDKYGFIAGAKVLLTGSSVARDSEGDGREWTCWVGVVGSATGSGAPVGPTR